MSTTFKLTVNNYSAPQRRFYFFTDAPQLAPGQVYPNTLASELVGGAGGYMELVFIIRLGAFVSQGPINFQLGANVHIGERNAMGLGKKASAQFNDGINGLATDLQEAETVGASGTIGVNVLPFNPTTSYIQSRPPIVGISSETAEGQVSMYSIDVTNHPGELLYFEPIYRFFVAHGNSTRGDLVNITSGNTNPNVCTPSQGSPNWQCNLNPDGTWSPWVTQSFVMSEKGETSKVVPRKLGEDKHQ
jgi:hypothetical protein